MRAPQFVYHPGAAKSGNQFRVVVRVSRNGKMIGAKYGPRTHVTAELAKALARTCAVLASIKFIGEPSISVTVAGEESKRVPPKRQFPEFVNSRAGEAGLEAVSRALGLG